MDVYNIYKLKHTSHITIHDNEILWYMSNKFVLYEENYKTWIKEIKRVN